jgi:hypothetical protein
VSKSASGLNFAAHRLDACAGSLPSFVTPARHRPSCKRTPTQGRWPTADDHCLQPRGTCRGQAIAGARLLPGRPR